MLKYHNIVFDKVSILVIKDEEEVRKTLSKRPGFEKNHILDIEMAAIITASAVLKV